MKLNQEALFVGMGLIFVDMCYGGFCYYDYKQGVLCFWDDIFAKGVDIVNTQNFYCKKSKVGIVKISQNPFDRRYGTCKMKLITRGECGKSIRVKYIMTKEVIRQISHQFKININV